LRRIFLTITAVLFFAAAGTASAEVLITVQEAALPPANSPAPAGPVRGISRPPQAVLEQRSATDKGLKSPLVFKVKFMAYGGTTIDPAATRVTYLKNPLVDLTPRLKKYIQPTGIEMPDAEIPPGQHVIIVELSDSNHHKGTSVLTLVVDR
jgi:hypothetical protein